MAKGKKSKIVTKKSKALKKTKKYLDDDPISAKIPNKKRKIQNITVNDGSKKNIKDLSIGSSLIEKKKARLAITTSTPKVPVEGRRFTRSSLSRKESLESNDTTTDKAISLDNIPILNESSKTQNAEDLEVSNQNVSISEESRIYSVSMQEDKENTSITNEENENILSTSIQQGDKNMIKTNKTSTLSDSMNFEINTMDEILCAICQQKMEDVVFFPQDPSSGKTEESCILDYRLFLFDGQERNESCHEDQRAYNKVTNFKVFCKNRHLCPFDSGLIESDKEIYFSGYIKPIYSEDSSCKDGVAGRDFGPIAEWWTTGFDVGEQPTVGLSTELGDYLLMDPSPQYAPFMENAMLKIFISKTVIEFLMQEPDATYEDLMYKLQTTKMADNKPEVFTEDDLMRLAPFIFNQIISFQEFADPDEKLLIVSPCIRRLIDIVGIDFKFYLDKIHAPRIGEESRKNQKKKKLYESCEENKKLFPHFNQCTLIDAIFHCNKIKIPITTIENREKCGYCINCQRVECRECYGCTRKKACWRKRCFWHEIQEANHEDEQLNAVIPTSNVSFSTQVYQSNVQSFKSFSKDVAMSGLPIAFDSGNTYYNVAHVAGISITRGDFVLLSSCNVNTQSQIMKVLNIWDDVNGQPMFHGNFYWWGKDTVLGDFANPKEVFYISLCSNISLFSISKKVKVIERRKPIFWNKSITARESDERNVFCEKSFDPLSGRFYDLPEDDIISRQNSQAPHRFCKIQTDIDDSFALKKPRVVNQLCTEDEKIIYEKVCYKNKEFFVGSTVYIRPRKLYFSYPMINIKQNILKNVKIDESQFTEWYRKDENVKKEPSQEQPPPLDIGFITQIYTIKDVIYIKVKKFYRPINTHDGKNLSKKSDLNLLFWSEEESVLEFVHVVDKCYVVHEKSLSASPDKWTSEGPDRFYFSKQYVNKQFVDVNKDSYKGSIAIRDVPQENPKVTKLKTLVIFSGCGGLALGIQRSGLGSIRWAVESDAVAASVFQLNMKKTTVFNENVKCVLDEVRHGTKKLDEQILPMKEEVELLCASIPGKNFKLLKNFGSSHVATFIDYCEYYKPILFIMDAHENLIKQNNYLKLTISCLVTIGYQVAFNVMQVGNFGAPQNCKRSVLLGAAPGYKLPNYPKNLHVFPASFCQYYVVVDDKKYSPVDEWNNSAPFRAMTVHDAISDLPVISFDKYKNDLSYYGKLLTHYQKMMRLGMPENVLSDHECKKLGNVVEVRILLLPPLAENDWRSLPNREIKLKDGTELDKLIYTHDDVEAGKDANGNFRGVCSCASGGKCDLSYKQNNTVIPWHLVHTANRHDQWAGLYSRLRWDGFFSNITNPELLGTEGPVMHPQQARIVSVRECARSQGFPDAFELGDTTSTHDKYRLIGQSSSPLLFLCLGNEIIKSFLAYR